MLVGRVKVPCAPDGTNILQKVIFMAGKIDRAAPRDETGEELAKRLEVKRADRLRQFKERLAEQKRREDEERAIHRKKMK